MSITYLAFLAPAEAQVKDHYGRVFVLKHNADVEMDVKHGDWKPVVPVVEDAVLHIAEADALWKANAPGEAVCLYQIVSRMNVLESRSAVQRLNDLSRKRDLTEWLDDCDPLLFYSRDKNTTSFRSDTAGISLEVLGSFRAMRARNSVSPDMIQRSIYLGHESESIFIAYDLWKNPGKFRDLAEYRRFWDKRRGISSTSTLSELNAGICWPARLGREGASKASCSVYEMLEPGKGVEYYEIGRFKGVFLGFSGRDRARDVLGNLRITK